MFKSFRLFIFSSAFVLLRGNPSWQQKKIAQLTPLLHVEIRNSTQFKRHERSAYYSLPRGTPVVNRNVAPYNAVGRLWVLEGTVAEGQYYNLCSAQLVTPTILATAAHCFHNDQKNPALNAYNTFCLRAAGSDCGQMFTLGDIISEHTIYSIFSNRV